jgi:excisionase family DNA binding protein
LLSDTTDRKEKIIHALFPRQKKIRLINYRQAIALFRISTRKLFTKRKKQFYLNIKIGLPCKKNLQKQKKRLRQKQKKTTAPKTKPRAKKITKNLAPLKDKQAAPTPPPQQDAEPPTSFIKEKLLSAQDVCRQLGISLRTLYSYLKEGLLPYIKIRGRIWFRDSELALALNNFRR